MSKRVAVLRGGPSSEYDVSMETGKGVIAALARLGYQVTDIPVTRDGEWIVEGRTKSPDKALQMTDVVFIAMHGAYGEDGTVQRICERLGIPFTGSRSFPSAVSFNKDTTKRSLTDPRILFAKHVKVTRDEQQHLHSIISAITETFTGSYVVKPLTSGSSHGVIMASTAEALTQAARDTLAVYDACMIEERIVGTEATCGVLSDFRDTNLYVLPPIEIVPPKESDFFDSTVKYNGQTAEICPGRFSYEERERIAELATLVHTSLGLSQYSRTDCIVRDGQVYFLEVNTLPGLTSESLFPKAAAAIGLSFDGLIDHLVKTARV